jgi:hypothetical protein
VRDPALPYLKKSKMEEDESYPGYEYQPLFDLMQTKYERKVKASGA